MNQIKIYNNYQTEDNLVCIVEYIKKISEEPPFMLDGDKKELYYTTFKFEGKVIKSFSPKYKEGNSHLFYKRKPYNNKISTPLFYKKQEQEEDEYEKPYLYLKDSFIKVNGIESF